MSNRKRQILDPPTFEDDETTRLAGLLYIITHALANARQEIVEREHAEEELRQYRERLQDLVQERTTELTAAIVQLEQEITHRQRVEEALRESEEKFRNIIESIPIGMHMYQLESDDKLVFTGANPAADKILGVDNQQFVGQTIEEAFPAMRETEVPDRYRIAASTGEAWQTDEMIYEENEIGGHIWAYSEEGQGSTFKVYLPRVKKIAQATPRPRALIDVPSGDETILLVEDDENVRDLARNVLQSHGYTILEARNGQEALLVSKHHPGPMHLLLTDVVMPGISGEQLAKLLTQARPDLKTLFMSGYTNNSIMQRGVLEPGIAFLQKPFSPTDLAGQVRQVLDTPQQPSG